jgi:hypothetical protein
VIQRQEQARFGFGKRGGSIVHGSQQVVAHRAATQTQRLSQRFAPIVKDRAHHRGSFARSKPGLLNVQTPQVEQRFVGLRAEFRGAFIGVLGVGIPLQLLENRAQRVVRGGVVGGGFEGGLEKLERFLGAALATLLNGPVVNPGRLSWESAG